MIFWFSTSKYPETGDRLASAIAFFVLWSLLGIAWLALKRGWRAARSVNAEAAVRGLGVVTADGGRKANSLFRAFKDGYTSRPKE